jgi:Mg/Co/Ni transporter MgtE
MSKELKLTLAYLEHAPHSAARDLQSLPTEDAAAFLESAPARLSAPVVNRMIPWGAARCLELLSHAKAASLLRQLNFHDSISLLRLIKPEMHDQILDELPTTLAKRFRNSLRYPLSQVGAWTDPAVPILSTNDTVQDALGFLRDCALTSHIFLESAENGMFAGSISVTSLMRSERARQLSQLPVVDIEPLSSRASLTSLAADPRWDEFLFLPVVGRRSNLLGGLSRGALRKGTRDHFLEKHNQVDSLIGYLIGALGVTVAGLFHMALNSPNGSTSDS